MVRWRSFDGLELSGLLVLPIFVQLPKAGFPLVVELHGGPMGGVTNYGQLINATTLEWQLWAEKGMPYSSQTTAAVSSRGSVHLLRREIAASSIVTMHRMSWMRASLPTARRLR